MAGVFASLAQFTRAEHSVENGAVVVVAGIAGGNGDVFCVDAVEIGGVVGANN